MFLTGYMMVKIHTYVCWRVFLVILYFSLLTPGLEGAYLRFCRSCWSSCAGVRCIWKAAWASPCTAGPPETSPPPDSSLNWGYLQDDSNDDNMTHCKSAGIQHLTWAHLSTLLHVTEEKDNTKWCTLHPASCVLWRNACANAEGKAKGATPFPAQQNVQLKMCNAVCFCLGH